MRFAFFFLAEYAAMALVSAVGAILFLGGWNFPFSGEGRPVVGLLQLGLKTFALLFMMLGLRWTLPRVRIDQVMYLCLKVLLPMGMFCLLGAGFQAVAGMALPLWGVVLALAAVTYLIGRRSPSPSPAA
jgi:NADH-quinone oxidoreductase subunit H